MQHKPSNEQKRETLKNWVVALWTVWGAWTLIHWISGLIWPAPPGVVSIPGVGLLCPFIALTVLLLGWREYLK